MKSNVIGALLGGVFFAALVTVSGATADDGLGKEDRGKFFEKRFEQNDTNKDGQVSQDEFLAAQAERAKAKFKRLDSNSDGMITKSEMESSRAEMKKKFKEFRDRQAQPQTDSQ